MQSPQRLQPANKGSTEAKWPFRVVPCYMDGDLYSYIYWFLLLSVTRKGAPWSQDIFQRGLTTRTWQDSKKFRERSFNPEESFWAVSIAFSLHVSNLCSLKVAAEFLVYKYQYMLCLDCELWLLCYYIYNENIPPYLKVNSLCQT